MGIKKTRPRLASARRGPAFSCTMRPVRLLRRA